MKTDNAKLLEAWHTFTIELSSDWTRASDREYYIEYYGPNAGFDHALAQIVKSHTALDTTIGSAIGFLHGANNPNILELVDTLPCLQRIESLKNSIHRVPPPRNDEARLMLDLNNCLTVEAHHNRLLSAVLADPEYEPWFYELHRLADYLWTVDNDLRESMKSAYEEYADYEDYVGLLPSVMAKGRLSLVRGAIFEQM